MAFGLPFVSAAGAAAIFIVRKHKPPRLVDALMERSPAVETPVTPPAKLPMVNSIQRITAILLSTTETSEAEKAAFLRVKQATLSVGLAVAGLAFYPLQIIGVLYLLPTVISVFKTSYQHLVYERRVTGDLASGVFVGGMLAGGFFATFIMGSWFIIVVHWLATKTEDHSKQGIINLFDRQIRSVWMMVDGVEVETPIEKVQAGDQIILHAGQIIPMDGRILAGYASIDQHILTGEAQPAEKGPGERVLAATLVRSGRITIEVEMAGEETTAAQIGRILTDTSDFKASLVSQATAFNDRMALPFLLASALSLPFLGVGRALSLLIAMPGYRMVLYGPLSMLSYLHLAAEQGILIKDGRSLESLGAIDTVVFDKTGTLTLEQPHVRTIHAYAGFHEATVLTFAAAAEAKQSHPIARAILGAAAACQISALEIDDAAYEIGYGITVKINGQIVRVGSLRFMTMHAIVIPAAVQILQDQVHTIGHTLVLVAVDDTVAGAIELQPTLRPEVKAIVRQLRARGLQRYIISGDHQAPTQRLAEELEMDGYFAEVLPEDKADLVKRLQAEGRKVCFVGDGINDSIALKSANVSISLHGANTIAIDAAQLVLMEGNLEQLAHIFTLADEFAANMRFNFLIDTIPGILAASSALFLGWGLLPCLALYQVSVPFALHNTVRPLLAKKNGILGKAMRPVIRDQQLAPTPTDKHN